MSVSSITYTVAGMSLTLSSCRVTDETVASYNSCNESFMKSLLSVDMICEKDCRVNTNVYKANNAACILILKRTEINLLLIARLHCCIIIPEVVVLFLISDN